jgi:hypothetical protein
MYKIEKTTYGIKIVLEGTLDVAQAGDFARDAIAAVETCSQGFGILRDMRQLKALSPEAEKQIIPAYQAAKKGGVGRQALIVPSGVMKMQSVRRAKEVGIYDTTRFIDASTDPNWEQTAVDWLTKGVDPDL